MDVPLEREWDYGCGRSCGAPELYRNGYTSPYLQRQRASSARQFAHDHGVHGEFLAVKTRGDGLGGDEFVTLGAPAGEERIERRAQGHSFKLGMQGVYMAVLERRPCRQLQKMLRHVLH